MQVLPQSFHRSPAPHRARDFFDQADIAEFAQGIRTRFLRRFAARQPVTDGFVEMAADFGIKVIIFALPEFHTSHSYSCGCRMPDMAAVSRSQLERSAASCFFPVAVS